MKTTAKRTLSKWTLLFRRCVARQRLLLATLCGLLLVSSSLAQEQRPAQPLPEQSTPEAAATPKAPDPNETLPPSPLANQTVDGDIIFTSPGQFTYPATSACRTTSAGCAFTGRTR